jgi:hypothetical protein
LSLLDGGSGKPGAILVEGQSGFTRKLLKDLEEEGRAAASSQKIALRSLTGEFLYITVWLWNCLVMEI